MESRTLSQPRFQVDALDGLRGLAVLVVIISHSSNQGMHIIPGLDFSGIGKSGVYLFFLLSAFLLTYPFVVKGSNAFRRADIANYFVRRFFRVYPLYFLYITAGLLTSLLFWRVFSWDEPKGTPLTLNLHEYLHQLFMVSGKGITWSIPVEFQFYFLLPILAWCFTILFRRNLIAAALLSVVLVAVTTSLWPAGLDENERTRSLGHHFSIFVVGSYLALVHFHWSSRFNENRALKSTIEFFGWLALFAVVLMIPSIASVLFPGVPRIVIMKPLLNPAQPMRRDIPA